MKKLVIIPAYNEEKSILSTVQDVLDHAPGFDYVVVNDCSRDHTRQVCREHRLNMLDLPINLGIGGAIQTGYRYALEHGYDMAVQFDGDGQHDASYLQRLADKLEQDNLDMVIGSRFIENPVSYTHLDVYKRQDADLAAYRAPAGSVGHFHIHSNTS